MRVVRESSITSTPWKNGGGVTREIAIFPPGSTLDSFAWRMSMATVSTDGAFSAFPGVDRRLYVLEGHGLILSSPSERRQVHAGKRVDFPGEERIFGELLKGPITDLNIMSRRSEVSAEVGELIIHEHTQLVTEGTASAVFVRDGTITVRSGDEEVLADKFDTILFDGGSPRTVDLYGEADIIFVIFRPCSPVVTPETPD